MPNVKLFFIISAYCHLAPFTHFTFWQYFHALVIEREKWDIPEKYLEKIRRIGRVENIFGFTFLQKQRIFALTFSQKH